MGGQFSLMSQIAIRNHTRGDNVALADLYRQAFPEEDLLSLLDDLLEGTTGICSLVAADEAGRPLGHVCLTSCQVQRPGDAVLLGPLAVVPDHQRKGIGRALVHAGAEWAARSGAVCVLVLGDPAYYGRLGFAAESRVLPPYDLPDAYSTAWQSKACAGMIQTQASLAGRLEVPAAWQDTALWLP